MVFKVGGFSGKEDTAKPNTLKLKKCKIRYQLQQERLRKWNSLGKLGLLQFK